MKRGITACLSDIELLKYAAGNGQLALIRELVTGGTDPNKLGDDGTNALHDAACGHHTDAVAALLDNGALVDSTTRGGNTALNLVAGFGYSSITYLLARRGANLDHFGDEGTTPLYDSIVFKCPDITEFLLDAGADPNVVMQNESMDTALHVACEVRAPVVAFLLDHGADPTMRSVKGLMPIHCAVQAAYLEGVKLLLHAGSPLDAQDNQGYTPSSLAQFKIPEARDEILNLINEERERRRKAATKLCAAALRYQHVSPLGLVATVPHLMRSIMWAMDLTDEPDF